MNQPAPTIQVKLTDEILGGVYSNSMQVTHTREEFVLDFMSIFPPAGKVNARVIISPGHMKRIILALQDNLRKYEAQFGPILEAPEPPARIPELEEPQ
ncbi:MAG TPA: DUF3467 domain-containing protein [Candidatus Polarisedimenticolia bacterium]|jgi:hypothetical protein|nr:DUF3467 domain-containing protein [Candidatus Polarisedimenticolia bacterium]